MTAQAGRKLAAPEAAFEAFTKKSYRTANHAVAAVFLEVASLCAIVRAVARFLTRNRRSVILQFSANW